MVSCVEVEPTAGVTLRIAASGRGICQLSIERGAREHPSESDDPVLREAARQLRQYFRGERRSFDLPLDLRGTPFQLEVWSALQRIPYGEMRTYLQLALEIGRPKAIRAVGSANGANPIAIVVPCHRVVASNGGLGGYSAGLDFKEKLLALEAGSR